MTWVTRTVVIPASMLALANDLAKAFDPDSGGDKTFIVGLSATGSLPVTHYISQLSITEENAPLLLDAVGFHTKAAALAGQRSRALTRTRAEVTTLRAAVTVSDQPARAVATSLGLQFLSAVDQRALSGS